MSSNSERTFGSRITNAKTLNTYITSFTDFAPPKTEDTPASYQAVIDSAETKNADTASAAENYSLAVESRLAIFFKNPDSLIKILSPIGAAVRNTFGKTSKQASDIAALIVKIRGIKVPKEKKDSQGEFVSQSERSFGSITQTFADIIATLDTYGGAYKPANPKITIVALKLQLAALQNANTAVPLAFAKLTGHRDQRIDLYDTLSANGQSIKDAVKSQYTIDSTNYKLVKGLLI